jgi:hypothetical protein
VSVLIGHPYGAVTLDGAPLGLAPLTQPHEMRHADHLSWAHTGPGAAELARAILVALYPDDVTVRAPACYDAFKFAVIATLPRGGWTLSSEDVAAWFARWRGTA